jgi:hypothetical protein
MEDRGFADHLEILVGNLKPHESLKSEGAALLLNRYAASASSPENIPLRILAVEEFGNPLLNTNRHRWKDVGVEAREMVAGWLKGFLIDRFFEVLSHDRATDKRRPKFWLQYSSSIENMWFLLGPAAMDRRSEDYVKLRQTMGSHCIPLRGSGRHNNAFVMKVGPVYVIEFGQTGNATYLYHSSDLPVDLEEQNIHITSLRDATVGEKMTHMDGYETWERKFAAALLRHGIRTDGVLPPTLARTRYRLGRVVSPEIDEQSLRHAIKRFCAARGLRIDDRAQSGRIVVYASNSNSTISQQLREFGFTYSDGGRWDRTP